MSQHEALLGKDIRVQYRAAGAIHCSSGRMVRDTERSIVIEERFNSRGTPKTARIEVPHNCVVAIEEVSPHKTS